MELYNLNKDPGENRNLADEERDILDKLELQMQRWLETKLKKRPDPVRLMANTGLPPLKWVERAGRQFEAGATYEELRKRMGY